ncbi:MAG: SEC-C metal-binding domain-containing protein, partial [Gammaproteobacteria bacterium]|nr:SEC-C metal-binding domain-containing protein [Gammaproteobacteria bacterium]
RAEAAAPTAAADTAATPPAPPGAPSSLSQPSQPSQPFVRTGKKIGRNEPCPCGSGKKFKQCHGKI